MWSIARAVLELQTLYSDPPDTTLWSVRDTVGGSIHFIQLRVVYLLLCLKQMESLVKIMFLCKNNCIHVDKKNCNSKCWVLCCYYDLSCSKGQNILVLSRVLILPCFCLLYTVRLAQQFQRKFEQFRLLHSVKQR